jgi:NADH-quinone oxidoreductase subunit B
MSALQLASPDYAVPGYDGRWYDLAPHQANLLLVAGRITAPCSALIEALYGQLAPPRWVIACGTCASSGTLLDTIPARDLLPVDVELPGCPPHPVDLCNAMAQLSTRRRR